MHMARLADPSRLGFEYSLAQLSKIYADKINDAKEKIINHYTTAHQNSPLHLNTLDIYKDLFQNKVMKKDILTLFGTQRTLKSGGAAKKIDFPNIEDIHTNSSKISEWVEYSSFDAEITYFLRETLAVELCKLKTDMPDMPTLYHLYHKYWLPFGELLTEIEREGIKIDLMHLKNIQLQAEKDCAMHEKKFLQWVYSIQEDAKEFNPNSTQQMQHLLFAPYYQLKSSTTTDVSSDDEDKPINPETEKKSGYVGEVRVFKVENSSVL